MPTRRTLLGLFGGALVPLAGLPAAAEASGEFRIVFPSLWNEALDPILSSASGSLGLTAIYDDLVGAEPDGSAFSKARGLAEDWSMSPDGRQWTFRIRRGVRFHRGFGELTAEDVRFSLERISSERSVAQVKAYFKTKIARIEAPDPVTLRVTAARDPIPDLLTVLSPMQASTERFVVSKKAVETLGEAEFARNPVGSGPYEFARHLGGQSIAFRAVTGHWRVGAPRFAGLRLLAVPEEETSLAMLQRGDADLVPVTRANIGRLRTAGIAVVLQAGANSLVAFMDDQFVPTVPVHEPPVREALNLAIDRKAIVDSIFEGHGRPIGTYYAQTRVLEGIGYDWKADLYPFDPARAKRLLAEAGFASGFDLDVYIYPWTGVPEAPDTMQAVAGMWSEIGVRPNLIQTEYGVVRAKLLKGEMPGAVGYFQAPGRPWQGVPGIYRVFMHSTGAFGHVKIPELDRLIDGAAEALDPEAAKSSLKQAMAFIRANHLAVPLLEFDQAYGVSARAKGWNPGFLPQNLNLDSLLRG